MEPDVSRVLAEKRRQIDYEVVHFRALKEKEFQDFEKDLLRQRQKRKRDSSKPKDGSSPGYKGKAPNALSLLGVLNQSNAHMDGSVARQKESSAQENGIVNAPVPASRPTLSLDKLNIKGETTPPLTADGSPPSPTSCLKRQFSKSPPNHPLSLTPPRGGRPIKQDQAQLTPPTPTTDHITDSFAGIFSPAYYHSRISNQRGGPEEANSDKLLLLDSKQQHPVCVDLAHVRKDRALTAPLLPSNSLPSALRTASGTTVRKRKRVTFQLADRAIVEPSSSYEGGPSPMREDELDFNEKIDDVIVNGNDEPEPEDEVKSGLAKRTIRSPMIAPKEREGATEQEQLSPKSALEVSVDGDSGIGFLSWMKNLRVRPAIRMTPNSLMMTWKISRDLRSCAEEMRMTSSTDRNRLTNTAGVCLSTSSDRVGVGLAALVIDAGDGQGRSRKDCDRLELDGSEFMLMYICRRSNGLWEGILQRFSYAITRYERRLNIR